LNRSVWSVSILWFAAFFGSGSTFLIYSILARELGANFFGLFSSIMAIISVLSMLAGFGIPQVWLKVFGREGWCGLRWLVPSLKLSAFSSIIAVAILYTWALLGDHSAVATIAMIVMSAFLLSKTIIEAVVVKLLLEENYLQLSCWQVAPNLLVLLAILFIGNLSSDVLRVFMIYALIGGLFVMLGAYELSRMRPPYFKLHGHGRYKSGECAGLPSIRSLLGEAWPFATASVFAFTYSQSDILMVKYISGNTQAGFYSVASIILTAVLMFPAVLYGKYLLPKLHRWANHDHKRFYETYRKGNIAMLLGGFGFMLIVSIASDYAIPVVYGEQYVASIGLVKLICFLIPIYFLAYSVGSVLVTKQYMKIKVRLMGYSGLINIILNALLIPTYQAKGAAFASIISSALLLAQYFYMAERKVFKTD